MHSAINIAGPLPTLRLCHQRRQLPPLPLYWLQLCKAASVTCRSTNNHYKPKYSLPSNVASLHHLSLSSFTHSTYTNTAGAVVLRNRSGFSSSSHFDNGRNTIYTSKLKKLNFRKGYRDCIKRYGDKAWMQSTRYIVTSCHGNDDEMWSTSRLIIQHKPYIVEQPPPLPFINYHYTKVCKYACLHFQCLGIV